MSNSLSGVNLAKIAQASLEPLLTELVPLTAFMTDFSNEIESEGETITTRYPSTNPTAKAMLSAADRVPTDVGTTPKTVTLNRVRGFDYGFNDLEMTLSSVKLRELFIQPGVTAVAEEMISYVLALATVSAFPDEIVLSSSEYDSDALSDIATELTTDKIPRVGRTALINPAYYGNLTKDADVKRVDAFGNDSAVKEHSVPRVAGINQLEYNGTIPTNSQNLVGIVGGKQGLLIAARQIVTPQGWYGQVVNVTEPVTKLPLQFRYFYDGVQHRLQMIVLYGASVGHAGYLKRIVSAAN